jgi:hypothetical protein
MADCGCADERLQRIAGAPTSTPIFSIQHKVAPIHSIRFAHTSRNLGIRAHMKRVDEISEYSLYRLQGPSRC